MEWTTTSAILEGLKDFDDTRTWLLFVTRFRPVIVSFARRRGLDEDTAEDVAQAALLSFAESYRRGRYVREMGPLSTWLFTISHRRVVDVLRGLDRRPTVPWDDRDLPGGAEVRDQWTGAWESALLEQCLARVRAEVRPKTWAAFSGVFIEEREPAEVAEALGVTRNAVFIAKYRVLSRLKQLRSELDHEP